MPRLGHVPKGRRAVKFVRGRTVEVGPGLHLYWPITTAFTTYPVVRQVLDVPAQTLTTKDGRTVVAGGLVVFSIDDLTVFLVENYEAEDSVSELAQAGIRKAIVSKTFEEVQGGRADLDNKLTTEAQKVLKTLGVTVEFMRLTDFAEAHAFVLIGDGFRGSGE